MLLPFKKRRYEPFDTQKLIKPTRSIGDSLVLDSEGDVHIDVDQCDQGSFKKEFQYLGEIANISHSSRQLMRERIRNEAIDQVGDGEEMWDGCDEGADEETYDY